MQPSKKIFAVGALASCLLAPMLSRAESGTYVQVVSLLTNYTKSDRGSETIIGGSSSGTATIVRSSGGPFVEASSGVAECIVYARKSPRGMDLESPCTTADSSGDKVFLLAKRKSGDVNAGGGGEGTWNILGGTGKYSDMTGNCTYKVDYLPGNRLVAIAQYQWQK